MEVSGDNAAAEGLIRFIGGVSKESPLFIDVGTSRQGIVTEANIVELSDDALEPGDVAMELFTTSRELANFLKTTVTFQF
jgi:hypothetical protein